MDRSATEHQVLTEIALISPSVPVWILVASQSNGDIITETSPVLAIRTFVVNRYCIFHTSDDEPRRSPSHVDLLQSGWRYLGSNPGQDILFIDNRTMCLTSTTELDNKRYALCTNKEDEDAIVARLRELNEAETLIPSKYPLIVSKKQEDYLDELIRVIKDKIISKAEQRRKLRNIMSLYPKATLKELSNITTLPTVLISNLLGLVSRLDKQVYQDVESGKINLMNAYLLTKLPVEEQGLWESARLQDPLLFEPRVNARIAEIKKKEKRELQRKSRRPISNTE